jgi:Adenylate and Guanylate cyclase catalytic domain
MSPPAWKRPAWEGRIQVPQHVYERLKREFVFEERGDITVKGKGVMRTWFLVAQRDLDSVDEAATDQHEAGVRWVRSPGRRWWRRCRGRRRVGQELCTGPARLACPTTALST